MEESAGGYGGLMGSGWARGGDFEGVVAGKEGKLGGGRGWEDGFGYAGAWIPFTAGSGEGSGAGSGGEKGGGDRQPDGMTTRKTFGTSIQPSTC